LWAPVWEFLQLWLEEAKAERPTRPETLYHYTDVAGLMGILGTQQLWASHAGLLNDESELTLTLGLLNEIIRREPELGDSNPAADTLMINVASNLWYFYDAYIVCFCTEGDLLSQWRGYARPGGYSIGLDPNTFPHTTLTNLDLIPVRYDANAHVERVRELVKRWRVAFRFGYDTASDIARRLGLVFATALTRTAVTFKHPAFHEVR